MKTIEERATEYANKEWTPEYHFIAEESYIAGATEQKTIDIEKAKNAFNNACGWLSTFLWYNEVFEKFMKNLEE